MADFKQCSTCGNYGWVDTHKCPPAWEVREKDCVDWHVAYGTDAAAACEKFCENYDSENEYHIIRNGSAILEVRRQDDDGDIETYDIEAESRPHYYASKADV